MKKFKLDKDQTQEPSKEEIEQFKDFDKLLTNYQRTLHNVHHKPFYKNPKFFLAIVMFLLIIYLVFESTRPPESKNRNPQQEVTK